MGGVLYMTSISLHSPLVVPLKQDATIVGLVGLAHASSHFSHLLLAPLFPVFMTEFGLIYAELGLLMSTGLQPDLIKNRPELPGLFSLAQGARLT